MVKFFAAIVSAIALLGSGVLIGIASINAVTNTETPVERDVITTKPSFRLLSLSSRYAGIVTEVTARTLEVPRSGTITKQTVEDITDGSVLLELDSVPIIAVFGDTPFWRDLTIDSEGADVEMLEQYLGRLGYLDTSDIDLIFDFHTELAVEQWRDHYGIPDHFQTGPKTLVSIPPDQEYRFFASNQVGDHVIEHESLGRIVGAQRAIVVSIPVSDSTDISIPTDVEWRLPGGTISGSGALTSLDEEITVATSGLLVQKGNVEIDDKTLARRMPAGSPLEVSVVTDARDNVLTVPVGQLTVDTDGEPALLVSDADGNVTLTRVEVGLVAQGYAEIIAGVDSETPIVIPLG